MIYTENLEKEVLEKHFNNNADELIFLGGFIGPEPISELSEILNEPSTCKIIYGCYKAQGIDPLIHKKYQKITTNSVTNIYYKHKYNHTKMYLWRKEGVPVDAMIGSANFSKKGLNNDGCETLMDVPEIYYNQINAIMENALNDSSLCTELTPLLRQTKRITSEKYTKLKLDTILSFEPPEAKIYLGDKVGHVNEKSGLNWGFGKGNVAKDCSYIPLRKSLISEISSLFPNNGINLNRGYGQGYKNKKEIAECIFDDGTVMGLSFEGYEDVDGYFKQLTSFPKNNILGRYLRKRLGLRMEEFITFDHLKAYGRTDINIKKIEDGIYSFDFSI